MEFYIVYFSELVMSQVTTLHYPLRKASQNMGFLLPVFSCIRTEAFIREKCGSEKARTLSYFTQQYLCLC